MRHVSVVCLGADNGKTILVVCCINPSEAYASKDQKHLCFIRGGKLVLPDKDPQPISANEEIMIVRAFYALQLVLMNLFET